ncbi:MAG: sensor histidine kinase [Armatimonadota bacterium]
MNHRKPGLTTYFMHRQMLATALSLIIVLIVMVASVDHLLLMMAASELHELQTQQPIGMPGQNRMDSTFMPTGGGGQGHGAGGRGGAGMMMRGGAILLNAQGQIIASKVPGRYNQGFVQSSERWTLIDEVLDKKQMHGVGRLPWVNTDVVWYAVSDGTQIDVRWKRVDMVRTDSRIIYLLVIFAVLASGLVSLAFSIAGARRLAHSVNSVAQQSTQMADGQFKLKVAAQPTMELQQLADNLNDMAQSLDQTIQELQTEHHRLERLEGSQRQFVADASHELRAPLSSLNITLSAWEEGMLEPDEQEQTVRIMHKEVQRLSRIVSSMLDLSRIEAGHYPLDIGPVDLHDVVDNTLASLSDDGAPIHTELPESLPLVSGCADGLQRILVNLLDNARRYTPSDGSISVTAEQSGPTVALSVTDTGCGIPDYLVTRIWQRFNRGSTNRSDPDEGVGLGLSIVRGLTEAMGGEVSLHSEPGIGTKFTVNIPVFDDHPENI